MTNGSRIAATPRRTVEPHWTDLVALVPDSRTPPYLLLLSLKSAVSLLFSTLLGWRWSLSLSFMASSLTISRNRPTRKVFVAPHNVQPHLMNPRKLQLRSLNTPISTLYRGHQRPDTFCKDSLLGRCVHRRGHGDCPSNFPSGAPQSASNIKLHVHPPEDQDSPHHSLATICI